MNECLSLIREQGFFRPVSGGRLDGTVAAAASKRSMIDEQIGRRIFWILFLGARYVSAP
jgi:hypothetical protein